MKNQALFFSKDETKKLKCHTCDKFQRGIREVFLSFPGGF